VELEQKLFDAVRAGRVEEVREILEGNPTVDVNWNSSFGWGNLRTACCNSHEAIISLLLAHPAIDVNQKDTFGKTPLFWGCFEGKAASVRLLLQDQRVLLDEPSSNGYTPLRCAALNGHHDVIRCWIASGRDFALGEPGNPKTDAVGAARKNGKVEVAELLERFRDNQEETRAALSNDTAS